MEVPGLLRFHLEYPVGSNFAAVSKPSHRKAKPFHVSQYAPISE